MLLACVYTLSLEKYVHKDAKRQFKAALQHARIYHYMKALLILFLFNGECKEGN